MKVRFSVFALAVILTFLSAPTLYAESMYDKFMKMEAKIKQLESQIEDLSAKNEALSQEIRKANEEAEEDEEEGEANDTEETASAKAIQEDRSPQDESANDDDDEEADDEADDDADENDEDEDEEEEESIEEQIADMQESITDLNKATATNHVKFNVDYRFSVDNINYEMANGKKEKNDALLTNRLWLNMGWAATEHLSFKGQLAYYKAFGERSFSNYTPLDNFDWVANENPYDANVRVKNAYFLYQNSEFLGTPISWTFSIGRRPSTNGHLISLRDDDPAASPNGHSINVEFDGLSAKFGFEEWVPGMYIKFCAGRGLTNASSRFFAISPTDGNITSTLPSYVDDSAAITNIDLAGFIFVPYSDGQYTLTTQYYYAMNLIDAAIAHPNATTSTFAGFETVGNLHSITASFIADGIGDGLADYLDDTVFFLSGAMTITDPKSGEDMLHTSNDPAIDPDAGKKEKGYSVWVGLNMPSLISDEGKWGIEYNWGSQYWRSVTYAEDTMIGSKVAARGNAYEIYFTEPLVEDILTMQIRYTLIDYDYTGSNGFFGYSTGAAMKIEDLPDQYKGMYVDKAQDIRFYIRYRY